MSRRNKKKKFTPQQEQPFMTHLIELRTRLLRLLAVVVVIFLCLAPFANQIYSLLAQPLMRYLPEGATMIATEVASPFVTPFKLAFMVALVLAVPYMLHQVWSFIAPGLYKHERKIALPLLVSSILLFYAGMAFAYFVVFPMAFGFLLKAAPEGVTVMTDISKYLDFVLVIFFAFGVSFEVPVATILLVWSGMTTPENLVAKRSYVIVGAFIAGAVLTPPDVLSQFLLAVPMWLLFELGVVLSRMVVRVSESEKAADEANEQQNGSGSPLKKTD